ncbi:Brix-domain-containing protein [Fistulina hepatica ATCC 64428]|uniref:Brix-domain-containing protein n=1 Tax=Fistulina hepatica ATCC 64428 TaxID=1128425 RepID=A0A0D7AMN7_9AGAR|nr:Brix-domain-containing protein [Fistulina hepatica ATCC 64428]
MPAHIRNKEKRQEVARKSKKTRSQDKLSRRIAQAKLEKQNPALKAKRRAQNVPRTLDNMREYDPSYLTAPPPMDGDDPSSSKSAEAVEQTADIDNDPFAQYFTAPDPTIPPKFLITTGPQACKTTYEFCDELVGIFPGAEFIRRKKGKGFELGRIAGWAAKRGYKQMCVVNEDHKKPNAMTLIHLPHGPTASFKLTSVELTKDIFHHARATAHHPELVLNGFGTRLGLAVGRMFQTCFPALPEFQGRQVVTLHNQRDFLFFRRHRCVLELGCLRAYIEMIQKRYAFRNTEKAGQEDVRVAMQEIGPRFTLKLRWMKCGVPSVKNFGAPSAALVLDADEKATASTEQPTVDKSGESNGAQCSDHMDVDEAQRDGYQDHAEVSQSRPLPMADEYIWLWKPELETSRKTFFL